MTAADEAMTRLVPTRDQVIRLLRSDILKALIGTHLIVAAVILVRSYGWLQPFELAIYDQLRVAWAGHEPSANIPPVGGTEDIGLSNWPLRDGDLATLLERIVAWRPRVIGWTSTVTVPSHPVPTGSRRSSRNTRISSGPSSCGRVRGQGFLLPKDCARLIVLPLPMSRPMPETWSGVRYSMPMTAPAITPAWEWRWPWGTSPARVSNLPPDPRTSCDWERR
jgi:hypothetical protein